MDLGATLRLDRWLWFARFHKTRGQAAEAVAAGRVRLNGEKVRKPARSVSVGDMLTISRGGRVRVVKVLDLGSRRGPAPEARGLYEDHGPEPAPRQETRAAETGRNTPPPPREATGFPWPDS